ncbi:MAG TPA: RidA family protein [Pseudolabrys sp.]|nr:RidA family protein [Pseudolabrys sp.]
MTFPSYHFIEGVAAPISPSCHAVELDGWVFLTGQIARDLANPDAPLPEGIELQTERTLRNIEYILSKLGLSFRNMLSARVFLTDFPNDYGGMNTTYAKVIGEAKPARTCVGVTHIARGAKIEIDCIARRAQVDR